MLGKSYFTVWTFEKAVFYCAAIGFVAVVSVAVLLHPFVTIECHKTATDVTYENPSYKENPCKDDRIPQLFYLSVEECVFARRILVAVFLGGLIGWERRQADRPAGIRTMALVSLGSCLFSICSAVAFIHGPMGWDASRVSAAIPSGVGFLGSALIFKQHQDDGAHMVHGLTTAASVWLSAAVGIACSGGFFFVAAFSCAIMLLLLRFGPRYTYDDEEDDAVDDCEPPEEEPIQFGTFNNSTMRSHEAASVPENIRLLKRAQSRASIRNRPSITVE
jgi:uncharacterized membrane protein YhiD involved in acid resistance